MGIFGLASSMAIQRTKEIGIRKVLGAGVWNILFLLVKDFLLMLSISYVISLPLAYFGIGKWLSGFAHQMPFNIGLFLLPLVIVTVITLSTIGFHVIRAAMANPVDSIRYE
jgi:ABC-type antimicrobial peptide transport system permease subunit